jgi:hypothetical protein
MAQHRVPALLISVALAVSACSDSTAPTLPEKEGPALAVASALAAVSVSMWSGDLSYRNHAAGCSGDPNPYRCVTSSPGPIRVTAAPGWYRVTARPLPGERVGGLRAWSGSATAGKVYTPVEASDVDFEHVGGEISLYFWDWAIGDNNPAAGWHVELQRLPADGGAYTDGFEAATLDPFWARTQQGGTVALSRVTFRTGAQSLALSPGSGAQRDVHVRHHFATAEKGQFSIGFYDDAPGSETLYQQFRLLNSRQPSLVAAVGTMDFDASCYAAYVTDASGNSRGPNAACGAYPRVSTTSVRRVRGWHVLKIVVNAASVSLAIDGQTVLTVAGDYRFDIVDLALTGPSWRPPVTAYFDDFSFKAGCMDRPANLVGWWGLDGSAQDRAGANHGTLLGSPTLRAGVVRQSYALNGLNQSVVVPDGPALNPRNQLTLAAWVLYTGGRDGVNRDLVGKEANTAGRQYLLNLAVIDRFGATVVLPGGPIKASSTTVPAANRWYHVLMTYDGAALRLYVDGRLEATTAIAGTIVLGTEPLRIGGGAPVGMAPDHFPGVIDEVMLFNRALTPTEAARLNQVRSAGLCS